MPSRSLAIVTVTLLVLASLFGGRTQAAEKDESRLYLDKATAAYGLGHYAVAAENFEKVFELKPAPALLYNAAQAYRLAGNKERALELYESYLRVYGKQDKGIEIEGHIKELKQAIGHDKAVATSPPTTTEPVSTVATEPSAHPPSPAPALPAALPPADNSSPVLVSQPADASSRDESVVKKPWFWVATGGVVVAAAIVVVLLATSGAAAAMPSLGRAKAD
jgi:tetratricopeptide (TPR) repeat protein